MQNWFTIKRYSLIVLFAILGGCQVYGNTGGETTYYAKVKATARPTGAGTVYAAVSNGENGTTGSESTATGTAETSGGNVVFTFTATPNDNYDFKGWSETDNVNATTISESQTYTRNYAAATSEGENNAINYNLYAIFAEKPLFYFSGVAVVTPSGAGTVTVNPETTSARGEKWNSTSATTNAITFSASPELDYEFLGWSNAENGEIVSSNNPYKPTITSTSKNSGDPTKTTLYARFKALSYPTNITATPTSITLGVGDSSTPISVAINPSNAYRNIGFEAANTSIATVDANGVVTGKAIGNTTITVKALKSDGTTVITTTTVPVTVIEQCATPVITIDKSTGLTTITCSTDGATIYYTTDGSNPTNFSTPYGGAFTVVEEMVIKAIAVKDGYKNSAIATLPYTTSEPTGISGGVVTLNDLEDHKWSYYSDEDCPIHSLNPADVKITYYGNGTKTVTTTNDDNPTSFTADATGVKVGIDADANTFVYYKTLERRDGSTAATPSAATGRCAYTTIPNPFSVRPTYGSGDTRWRGFYKWRVKKVSGGTIHSASTGGDTYAQGSTINAEEEIYFAPSSEYGMEVEFEALWARAYVTDGTSNLSTRSNSYERNFHVVKSSTSAASFQKSYPLTVTSYYPDGTSAGGSVTGGFTAAADTKFENITITGATNSTWTANGHDLIVGRGCSGIINYLRGISQNISNPNYTIRLESGTYNYFSALRGYQAKGGSNGTDTGSSMGGTPSIKVIFGCDYDRATNTGITDNLAITNGAYYGYSVSEGNNITYSETAFCAIVKSGKIGKGFTIDNSYAAKADGAFYIGIAGERVRGCRNLLIEGGQIASIAGGIDNNANQDKNSIKIRMKGGHVRGVVYGGGARSAAYGNRSLIFTGGTVTGWIGGGCNGEPMSANQTEDTYGGITYGASMVYFGGNAICGGEGSDVSINGSIGGIVFGAGKGVEGNTTSGRMANGTTVAIADNCNVQRDVYGGGNFGYAQTSTNIFVGGGTVQGGVFGGSNKNNGPVVSILMKDGTIEGGVYGGSNDTGAISDNVTMQINGGQVGTPSAPANIHGGGYGEATQVSGNVEVTLGTTGQTTEGVVVWGDVYGGSALGTVNSDANDHTYVTMHKGTINGSLYGGGLGITSVAANVNGPVKVKVHGGSVKATSAAGSGGVYGANNIYGAPQSSVTVDIYGTDPAPAEGQYALHAVYGGGNQADYTYGKGYPTVTVHNCNNSIEYVYGGGNAAAVAATDVTIWGGNVIGNVFGGGNGTASAANVNGDATTKIYGGTILNVYGGSNSQGTIGGTINVTVNSQAENSGDAPCTMNIGSVYGGGNLAASNVGNLIITCTGTDGRIDNVYGGANQANITGDIDLKINGGNIGNVFGGNNIKGDISGTISVTIGDDPNDCGVFKVDNVYGAGNLAPYGSASGTKGNYPVVNIYSGTVTNNVFGGGLGKSAIVYGNPQVTIGDLVAGHEAYEAVVGGDVYGGGDAANVVGTPVVNIVNKCNTTIGNVYGGGNAADVNGTDVNIDGGTITGMVFGGGHGDKTAEPQIAANVNGNVNLDITGGTIGKVFGGSNSKGNITGSIALNIQKVDGHCDMRIAEVYGGGNEADGNAGSLTIGCTGTLVEGVNGHVAHPENIGKTLEGIGAVYGGANNANIGNDVTLNINSGMVAKVFGGNNTGGTVNGDVTVNVNKSANTCGWYVGKVHGGGYGSGTNVAKDVTVNIQNGTIYGDVYGGSALGKVNTNTDNTTTVNLTGGIIHGDAYGGGLGDRTTEADVNGNVTVTLNGTAFNLATTTDDRGNSIPTSGRIFGCNNINGSPQGTVLVQVLKTVAKNSDGTTKTKPKKGSGTYELQAVYGGGNLAAYEPKNAEADGQFTSYTYNSNTVSHDNQKKPVQVVINGCDETSIEYVYGGGNAASTPATDVLILGSYEIGNVFGGGNGKDRYTLDGTNWNANDGADVGIINAAAYDANKTEGKYGTGNAMTSVLGGTVNNIFGGSNTKGNIVGQATTRLDQATKCQLVVKDIYGGGNEAYMDGNTNIQLGCIEYLKEIYGGAKNADVGSDINMTITSGHFDRVFGGNNLGGKIRGSITVNIEETGCNPITIGEIYGGGNKAAYSVYGYSGGTLNTSGAKLYNDPVVNILSFTSIGRVFGGGLGEEAVMVGSPTVNINEVVGANASNTSWPHLNKTINFNDGTASVTLPSHEAGKIGAIGTVFGGGNAAKVIGDTNVNIGTADDIIGVDIRGNVYGGGNQADVTGKTNVTIGTNNL